MRQIRTINVGKITWTERLTKEDWIIFFAYSKSLSRLKKVLDQVKYVYEWNMSHSLCREVKKKEIPGEVKKKEIPGLYACTRINTYWYVESEISFESSKHLLSARPHNSHGRTCKSKRNWTVAPHGLQCRTIGCSCNCLHCQVAFTK